MDLAERLQQLRKRAELTQTELAEKAGVSQQLVAKIENGRVRESKKLRRLAGAFGMTVEEFLAPVAQADARESKAGVVAKNLDEHTEKWLRDHPRDALDSTMEDEIWSRYSRDQKRFILQLVQLIEHSDLVVAQAKNRHTTEEPSADSASRSKRRRS